MQGGSLLARNGHPPIPILGVLNPGKSVFTEMTLMNDLDGVSSRMKLYF